MRHMVKQRTGPLMTTSFAFGKGEPIYDAYATRDRSERPKPPPVLFEETWAEPPEDLKCIHCGEPIDQFYDSWVHVDEYGYSLEGTCKPKTIVVREAPNAKASDTAGDRADDLRKLR